MQWLIDHAPMWALPYIYRLTEREWQLVLNGLTGFAFLLVFLLSVYCLLRGLGWRRYRGRWYSPAKFEFLIQELYSGVREGRVPDFETMRLLDQYVYGRKGSDLRKLTQRDAI